MIHQLNPDISVDTSFGEGTRYFLIGYGMHQISCWVIVLEEKGIVKRLDFKT